MSSPVVNVICLIFFSWNLFPAPSQVSMIIFLILQLKKGRPKEIAYCKFKKEEAIHSSIRTWTQGRGSDAWLHSPEPSSGLPKKSHTSSTQVHVWVALSDDQDRVEDDWSQSHSSKWSQHLFTMVTQQYLNGAEGNTIRSSPVCWEWRQAIRWGFPGHTPSGSQN